MKKNYIVKPLWLIAILLVVLAACKQEKVHEEMHEDPYKLTIDSGLLVLLKPTNQEVVSKLATVVAEKGIQLFSIEVPGRINFDSRNQTSIASRVGGRIERLLVKYNYQPIKKGDLIMEIYSPDLAAAQQELLLIARNGNDDGMLQKAKQRLSLLGMTIAQIDRVIRTGEVSYRIPVYSNTSGYILEKSAVETASNSGFATSSSMSTSSMGGGSMVAGVSTASGAVADASMNTSPVLLREGQYVNAGQSIFTIYKDAGLIAEFAIPPVWSSSVKKGTSLIYQVAEEQDFHKGKVGLIEPTLKDGERFSLARVYINDNKSIHVGQLVNAHIPILINSGWWLPKDAVWTSGNESVVFKKENSVFVPIKVKTGVSILGKVQIVDDITGWEIASNSYYLIDSESFVRPQNKN